MNSLASTTCAPLLVQGIAPEDRIPIRQKIAFSLGVNMDIVATALMLKTLWMPVFNIGLGMSPIVLGGILMVFRAWDAFTDPVMGSISDNARTRWGRRRPFMFVGAFTTALIYPLFWYLPPAWSDPAKAVALTVVGILFFTSYTAWSMPYYGLQLELTPDYDERTRLAAWGTLFAKIGYLACGWILLFIIYLGTLASGKAGTVDGQDFGSGIAAAIQPFLAWITHAKAGENLVVVGMRATCWLISIAILLFGLCPAIFVKERYYRVEASRQPKTPFLANLRQSFQCRPLRHLICLSFFLIVGSASIVTLGQYSNFYYVCGGDLAKGAMISGVKSSVLIVAGLIAIPLLTWCSERFDKRAIVIAMLVFGITGHLANFFLMTPAHPYWQVASGVVEAVAITAIWMFMPSMKADIADWDEHQTGNRREGSINAFYSWFSKAAHTLALGIGGVAIFVSGFDAKLPVQTEASVNRMFYVYLVLPVLFWGVALLFAWFYPLSRASAADIRSELEARRGKI